MISCFIHRKSRKGGVVEAVLPVTPQLLLCAWAHRLFGGNVLQAISAMPREARR
jgi:hypothetical protein